MDGAYWLIAPGSAGLAQGCRYALPLQAWVGQIMAAACIQLVRVVVTALDLKSVKRILIK